MNEFDFHDKGVFAPEHSDHNKLARKKILEFGLAPLEELAVMNDKQVQQLISEKFFCFTTDNDNDIIYLLPRNLVEKLIVLEK